MPRVVIGADIVGQASSPTSLVGRAPIPHDASGPQIAGFTYHNLRGWGGNASVYPTKDGQIFYLPSVNTTAKWQNSNNDSGVIPNDIAIAGVGQVQTSIDQSYFQYFSGANYLEIQISFSVATGTQQTNETAGGFTTSYFTPFVGLSETFSGLPPQSTVDYLASHDTGVNLSAGNTGGQTTDVMRDVATLGIDLGSAVLPDPIGIPFTALGLLSDILAFQNYQDSPHPYQTTVPGGPDGTMVQWAQATGGAWYACGNPCNTGGSNSIIQASTLQVEIPTSELVNVLPGSVLISGQNQLGKLINVGQILDLYAGASQQLAYSVDPASSIGGTAYLYYNSGCAPQCPTVPGATITIQQTIGNPPTYMSTYTETANSTAYWHFFPQPATSVSGTTWSASWANPLGTGSNASSVVPQAAMIEGANTTLNAVLNGGQVSGSVQGIPPGGTKQAVSGAGVKLCNNNGCIQTTTNPQGQYLFNFPIAGTTANPYSLTIWGNDGRGWIPTTYSGLKLPVGTTTTQNLQFKQAYNVTFTETGLVSGTSWSATLNGTKLLSTASSITFSTPYALPNGTYPYAIGYPIAYSASPSGGSVTVNGKPVSVAVTFKLLPTYTVKFTESGLPSGMYWSVTLGPNGGSAASGSPITFNFPSGTYSFFVPNAKKYYCGIVLTYVPNPSSGSVTVSGGTVQKAITFTYQASPGCPGGVRNVGLAGFAYVGSFMSMPAVVLATISSIGAAALLSRNPGWRGDMAPA